ncbi:MAG: hypothetical protein EZS28_052435, partial [Streblomastix strix]
GVNQDIGSRQQPTAPLHSIDDSDEQRLRWFAGDARSENEPREKDYPDSQTDEQPFNYDLRQYTDFAPPLTITEVEQENKRDKQVEGQQLLLSGQEMNKNMQYLGGLDWGLDPVNKYYGKTANIPKPVDYYLQDGALSVRQRKQYLAKEEKLNKPKPKINYIKAAEMKKQVEAQGKLKKQTGRKKKSSSLQAALKSTTRKSKKK